MKHKPKNSVRRFIGIILAVVSVALVYLVIANILFSRIYEMVSTSLIARAETKAATLEQDVCWPLAAGYKEQISEDLVSFKKTNPETIAILIYDKKGNLFKKLGDVSALRLFNELRGKDKKISIQRENLLAVGRPIRPEFSGETLGYLIYIRSVAGYMKFRKNMMIIAVVASVLVLLLMGKLLQSQVSVSMKNEKLLEGLQAQAEELQSTNVSMKKEIDERIRAEAELSRYRIHLEDLVEDRTQELMRTRDQLLDASQKASMAEMAQSMLSNVGNMLSSVNIATGMMSNMVHESQILKKNTLDTVKKQYSDNHPMLSTHGKGGDDLPISSDGLDNCIAEDKRKNSLSGNPKATSGDNLEADHSSIVSQFDDFIQKMNQLKETVASQHLGVKGEGTTESSALVDILEDAIQINSADLRRRRIQIERHYEDISPVVKNDKKIVQILSNLISLAAYAEHTSNDEDRIITLTTQVENDKFVRVVVEDNSEGIPQKKSTPVSSDSFIMRKFGHESALFTSVNAAEEIGGKLSALSDWEEKGVRLVFDIPLPESH